MAIKGQIKAAALDEALVNKALKANGLKLDGTLEARAQRLQDYYMARGKAKECKVGECSKCDGASDLALPACPFCGEGDEAPETTPTATVHTSQSNTDKEDTVRKEKTEPKRKRSDVAKTETKGNGKAEAKETKAEPAKAGKPGKGKPGADGMTHIPGKRELAKIQQLDECCEIVRNSTISAATNVWEVGHAIKKIHDSELWKLRMVEGVPVHTNFKNFVADEFGISHTYARSLMDIAAAYSEDKIKKLGIFKLKLLLAAPEEKRAALEAAAEGGASGSQLRDMSKGDHPKANPVITLAARAGQHVLPAYSRTKKDKETGEPVRAKSIKEDPWCYIPMENNTRVHVQLTVDGNGEPSFIVTVMREGQTIDTVGETVSETVTAGDEVGHE